MATSDDEQPEETGAAGTQTPSTAVVVMDARPALADQPILESLRGLAATRTRDITGPLVAAIYGQASIDLQNARDDLRRKDEDLRAANARITELTAKSAALTERVQSAQQSRRLRDFCIALGGILFATGVPIIPTSQGTLQLVGVVLTLVGAATLVFCYRSGDNRAAP